MTHPPLYRVLSLGGDDPVPAERLEPGADDAFDGTTWRGESNAGSPSSAIRQRGR